ncbi:hypothetical protein KTT_42400 [Tengunoibacter tsumagoiensis]|uniref:Thioredoxin domain-containing protein n=1 Tax=Tengunoibacter tsumagoiensis TaxID=2014871 RepID=A0A402A5U1_9CHLR|nr:hypothetical protein KTT_42400 [Tengunoibacter tsumagoiensis]
MSIINVALLVFLGSLLLTPKEGSNTSSGLGDMSSPLLGKAAPDFTLPLLSDGKTPLSLSSFKGKPVILNFWSSTCPPCAAEAADLQSFWSGKLQAQGVTFIGIDGAEKSMSDGQAFVQRYHVTYPNVKDTFDGSTGINYGIAGNPETYFIDAQGHVVARWLGPLTAEGLQTELAKMQVK